MSAVQMVNPNSEIARKGVALQVNINAAKGLMEVLRTNLGPRGTMKMLVGGAGDIKVTKDGSVLLSEMQIQHPTASMIARTATAQDDITGDGTTSIVLFVGELLKQSERFLSEGAHPSHLVEGMELAKDEALKFLDTFKSTTEVDREILVNVARTSLRTKLPEVFADRLAEIVVDGIQTIRKPKEEIDLFMVEIMHMQHRTESETKLVRGLVLDHGARHPDMPKKLDNCYILTCNVSLEWEKSEINSSFSYDTAEQRDKLVQAERKFTDDKVKKIIDLKRQVCAGTNKTFAVINQKGIDPMALDMLAKEGILGLRRAKRRNMERLTLACGGIAVNSVEDLTPDVLGFAGTVYEQVLGEEKYTFVEDVKNPLSCTILIKGPNRHSIAQQKDAIRDGLRAVKNAIDDNCVIPGAGAFEIACHAHLLKFAEQNVIGRAKLGSRAFAEALLVTPKVLAENSGLDAQESLIKLQEQHHKGLVVGLDVYSGDPLSPEESGIYDNHKVKKQILNASTFTATQLLYVDEIIRAGKSQKKITDQQ